MFWNGFAGTCSVKDRAGPRWRHLLRSATGIGKYWICKRPIQHTYEAMECLGGVGYIEENVACRLNREAPVNAIWEGSGNVQAWTCCGC